MTGFGRGEARTEDLAVTAEIRSVNHRFLDLHVRCPARYMAWEVKARALLREGLRRGKVDLFLGVREEGKENAGIRVNRDLLAAFLAEAERIRRESGLEWNLSFRDLLGIPDLFTFAPEGEDLAERYWGVAERAVRQALSMLIESREVEGERMRGTIRDSIRRLEAIAGEIAALAAENRELAQARLRERIEAFSGEVGTDPARLAQEAAYLVDRLDVTEECDRMGSHLAGLATLLDNPGGPVGKRFDFLLQELFRELNTAASKSAHAGISERVVLAKTELETVREQIQNVE
ncbi:MAG: YicC family protein [Deltaproteobacteria bacterium]